MKTAVLAALMVGLFGFVGTDDPAKALQELRKFSTDTFTAARANGPDAIREAQTKILAKAKEAVSGVDASKVEPKDGLVWAQLFQAARQPADERAAAERFLTSSPSADEKFSAQTMIVSSYYSEKNGDGIYNAIEQIEPATPTQISTVVAITAAYSDLIAKAKGLDATIALLNKVEARLDTKATDEKARQGAEAGVYNTASAKMELLRDAGQTDRALKELDASMLRVDEKSQSGSRIKTLRNQLTVVGAPAPVLNIERGYGDFPGLDKMKGKVVVLDFFAHWCGPCKAAFPEMKTMYADLHAKGLEIVGLTTYYGYYKAERGITKDAEYAKMADFVKEFDLPWAVQYGDRTNFVNYGVTAIPHVAVIDKKGVVRNIKIGYEPEKFPAFRSMIEKLLAEK
ncbi:TlpA family protein disulfide reductase [Fimbriimonas ginsengisoli]|uniref:TlpA family protein disulfide reductase n=1 Tax=Fimbriimonas ginsengisoli TaxID=1005039 RepID=UPI001D0EF39D|nr:TlpA disulfide reductase family protein [Fimbriimonas ginsengisoli]